MVTFDLHYHTNVYRLPSRFRERRLRRHRDALQKTNVDFVASTEHAYKRPFDAYLYLRDTVQGLRTQIIPGVEAITQEGVDIIFLFRDEDSLKHGVKHLKPFSWKIADFSRIQKDLDTISLIPHPFTPGKTGIVRAVGEAGFFQYLAETDYVEVHNGLSLFLLNLRDRFPDMYRRSDLDRQIENTFRLPDQFRIDAVGQAVGSDAHLPGHQKVVGMVEAENPHSEWFSFLKRRVNFDPIQVVPSHFDEFIRYRHLLATSRCVLGELAIKQLRKNMRKTSDTRFTTAA